MPVTAIEFAPGIFTDDSESLQESGWVDGNNFRSLRGKPELIGGWEAVSSDVADNPVRGAHAWAAASGDRIMAFGTATNLYRIFGGGFEILTPYKSRGTLVDPFATTNTSAVVTVTDLDHGLKTDDVVTFANADAVGGITINGPYAVTVKTGDTYTITHTSAATSTVAAGGGIVDFSVPLGAGLVDGVGGTGWGTGTYGTGFFGLPTGGDVDPATWSLANWGSNLLAVRNGGALYEYQPLPSYDEVLINGSFDTTANWTLGTGWSISGGALVATAGTQSKATQDVAGRLRGGLVYVMTITTTVTAGSFRLQIQSADLDDADLPIVETQGEPFAKTGTFTRRFYATQNPTDIILLKNSTFAGSIQSITIKPEEEAYRIQAAPAYSRGMFVDANRFVVLYGTVESDGDYNALCVRWSDQERNNVWLADVDNLAGEYVLGLGSRIVGGLPARGQNVIFTDAAVYTMRFTGTQDAVFSFELVGGGGGLLGKNAAAEHLGTVYYVGTDGQFRVYDGGKPQVIVCPVYREFWDNLSPSQNDKVFCGINAAFKEAWWFYPDKRDGNECSRYVAYNFVEDTWFLGKMPRSAWIPTGVYENPVAFDPQTGMAYFQERGVTANGGQIECFLKSGKFNIGDGDTHFYVQRYVPDFSNHKGTLDVTFDCFQWARGPQFTTQTYSITPTTAEIPLRLAGRVMQITYSNGTNFRSARWGTQALDVKPSGAKR